MDAQDRVVAIKAARLFDGVNDRMVEPGVVVVSGGRIQSAGSSAPAGATVIDLGDATLLPGFIDAHTHLTVEFSADYNGKALADLQRTIPEDAIRATVNARQTLMAGFTTVRDVGSSDFIDVGLRNAIDAGTVPGPRMLVAVHSLGSTGGHCDGVGGFPLRPVRSRDGTRGWRHQRPGPGPPCRPLQHQVRRRCHQDLRHRRRPFPHRRRRCPPVVAGRVDALVDEAHTLRRKQRPTPTARKPPSVPSAPASIPSSTAPFWTMRRFA